VTKKALVGIMFYDHLLLNEVFVNKIRLLDGRICMDKGLTVSVI